MCHEPKGMIKLTRHVVSKILKIINFYYYKYSDSIFSELNKYFLIYLVFSDEWYLIISLKTKENITKAVIIGHDEKNKYYNLKIKNRNNLHYILKIKLLEYKDLFKEDCGG